MANVVQSNSENQILTGKEDINNTNDKPNIHKEESSTHEEELSKIGKNIANVRKILGLTQVEFAKAIGITSQTLSLIECGNFELSNNIAAKIYFSLSEIVFDENLINALQLENYTILMIKQLMHLLHGYIRKMNSNFKTYLEKSSR